MNKFFNFAVSLSCTCVEKIGQIDSKETINMYKYLDPLYY